jgi:hypothetical protein
MKRNLITAGDFLMGSDPRKDKVAFRCPYDPADGREDVDASDIELASFS